MQIAINTMIRSIFIAMCLLFLIDNALAQQPIAPKDEVQTTIVRAYPNNVKDPDQGGDYTIEMGQEINLDVRGLGTWFQRLCQQGYAPDSVKALIAPALDPNGNVRISNEDWARLVAAAARTLCLYIDGQPFNDVLPFKSDPHFRDATRDSTNCPLITLKYRIRRGPAAADKSSPDYQQWNDLITSLYSRMKCFRPPITDLTIGLPGQKGIGSRPLASALNPDAEDNEPHGTTIRIRPYSSGLMDGSVVLLFLVVALGFWLSKSSDLIRDSSAIPNPGGRFPFSLGRCQLAIWTLVVLGSYLFIWLSTDDYNRFEIQAVGLLGISAATGLGAFAVNRMTAIGSAGSTLSPAELGASTTGALDNLINAEQTIMSTLPAGDPTIAQHEARLLEIRQRREYLKTPLMQFFRDILTEENSISIHRFQLAIWTLVLTVVFIRSVCTHLQMPVFDSTILILMGISGTTYVGFKWPTPK